ncbi:intraflagellar transport protein 122 homolog isoform X1 [Amyelois transitella]|uniref:intraflagellar transport protein 122 homolog isoform X1 n=1 Tax=Amyelois transitella TaxID=680683 RepID=UPI00299001F6|nr:intraflagellar transport protein 122 homolog isoform X1 [Amyelois transitella]
MRTVPKWVNKIHEADKVEFSSVHTICFSPDGTQLVVGAGEKVMVYDPRDGALVQLLQAHKGAVHAVAYCGDGKKFASGSADKNVIIWTSKMEGVLKYSHGEAIQCLSYNPVTMHLASCALSDFAFWSADVKAVQKHRVAGRITSCAWSPNGQNLAIGLAIGAVSIRDRMGDEVQRISRDAAVWAVTFHKSTLLVTDWSDTLSFYNVQGQQVSKDRDIGIAALSISMLGALVLVGGVGGWAVLTSEGVPILTTPQEWVWATAPSPTFNTVAVACQDGTLWCYQAVFSTVHGLYRERYAYRENMTDVIIQHLTTGNKVRIKCHDRVHKIAIYKHRLAVQLPERVVVYEQGDVDGMLYRVKQKLSQKTECSLLVATSDALLLCQDSKLVMVGRRLPKNWTMPAPIRYVKVTTLYFEEVLLLGLQNGQIWQVEPVSGASKSLLQTPASVRCLDVSASRSRVAVVDESSVCRVYSLPTGELLYTEENVSSVSWNSWCDDLLSLSGGGLLSIKAGLFPAATQPLVGSVVGFQGGRVFCLQANSMQTINVPLSHAVHQNIQQKMFTEAYAVACLGVTALDWERLGMAALEELSFEVAKKAFQRSENVIFLTLIDHLQERLESGEMRTLIVGDVSAHRGRYADAARAYRTAGRDDRALSLYVDLRMFSKAQEYVGEGEGLAALARRRAEWARHVNEPRAAAEMYLAAGDVKRAAQLMAETGRRDMLIELARKLDKGSSSSLRYVAEALVTAGEHATAADVYQRLGDYRKVAQLAVSAGEWSRAFALAREHSECRRDVYLPYAHKMAQESKFVDAQKAYHMAGETATAMRVFSILVTNAVSEERFSDAAYLHHLLAMQCLDTAAAAGDNERSRSQYSDNERLARVYHAYDAVHRCVHEPFSLSQPF